MERIIVKTQEELNSINKEYAGEILIEFGEYPANAVVENFLQAIIIVNKENTIECCDVKKVKAYDTARVVARKNTLVKAYNHSSVEAYANAKVIAYDKSFVDGYEEAKIEAYNNAQITITNQNVFIAHGNATFNDNVYYNGKLITGLFGEKNSLHHIELSANNSEEKISVLRLIEIK